MTDGMGDNSVAPIGSNNGVMLEAEGTRRLRKSSHVWMVVSGVGVLTTGEEEQ